MKADQIILDDGRFFIDLNCNYAASDAPGFLSLRCFAGPTTPGGFECLGSFNKTTDGTTWEARVSAPYDSEIDSDSRTVITGVSRMEAISALWRERHTAERRT